MAQRLGTLEQRLMTLLWSAPPVTVREVVAKLEGPLAYTTIMTTMDRLYKKGLLARHKDGIAYVYEPAMSRAQYHQTIIEDTVGALLAKSADPVMAAFVDTAAKLDESNLARLEQLIAERRKRGG